MPSGVSSRCHTREGRIRAYFRHDGTEEKGYTALHLASDRGQVDIVKLLLDNGADINAKVGGSRGHIS